MNKLESDISTFTKQDFVDDSDESFKTEVFPLKRDTIEFSEIYQIFLQMSSEHRVSFTDKNLSNQTLPHFFGMVIVENITIKRLELLTDYFQEQNRIIAKRFDQKYSPLEYWEQNKSATRSNISRNVKECGTFCATIICAFIKVYKPKHILDFCAGWGSRMIGAMTYDDRIKSFYGIDPNRSLHKSYQRMIKSYLPKHSHQKYQLLNIPAEDIISLLPQQFDLICTSPPYYKLENYVPDKKKAKTQSISKYSDFENWYNNFLLNCLNQCVGKLNKSGVLAININDYKTDTEEYNVVERLISDMSTNQELQFKGIVYFGNPACKTQIYQPILVWFKL